jgi:hypothetical protein
MCNPTSSCSIIRLSSTNVGEAIGLEFGSGSVSAGSQCDPSDQSQRTQFAPLMMKGRASHMPDFVRA